MSEEEIKNKFTSYMRKDRLPHIFCPGCGNGTIMNAFIKGMEKAEMDFENVAMVSGIGCSSRIPGYMNCDSLHTTHGRALSFATGLKVANKDLDVVVFTGDGDAASIGGNHLIHAARRNINLTVICINNNIYGMTGGQISPTSPKGSLGTTAPYGNKDSPFKLADRSLSGFSFPDSGRLRSECRRFPGDPDIHLPCLRIRLEGPFDFTLFPGENLIEIGSASCRERV